MKCDNKDCAVSTGIHDGLTFGSGTLDKLGFWEHPCRACAVEYDLGIEVRMIDFKTANPHLSDADIARDHRWLVEPAWPYK